MRLEQSTPPVARLRTAWFTATKRKVVSVLFYRERHARSSPVSADRIRRKVIKLQCFNNAGKAKHGLCQSRHKTLILSQTLYGCFAWPSSVATHALKSSNINPNILDQIAGHPNRSKMPPNFVFSNDEATRFCVRTFDNDYGIASNMSSMLCSTIPFILGMAEGSGEEQRNKDEIITIDKHLLEQTCDVLGNRIFQNAVLNTSCLEVQSRETLRLAHIASE